MYTSHAAKHRLNNCSLISEVYYKLYWQSNKALIAVYIMDNKIQNATYDTKKFSKSKV